MQAFSKYHVPLDFRLLSHPDFKISEHAGLYITGILRVFAISLVGIYLPIYIFEISQSPIYQIFHGDMLVNGIIWGLIFYMLRSVFTIFFAFILVHTIFTKWGFGKTIMLSVILLIIEIVLWIFAEQNLWLILPIAILNGAKIVTYWIPYHIFFAEKMKGISMHFGGSTAKRQFFNRMASALAPVLGGVIIQFLGFKILFLFSIFILILCGLPTLYIVNDWPHKDHYPHKIAREAMKNKKFSFLTLGFLGQGLDVAIYTVLWPMLMFIILLDFEKIGFLTGISFTIASLVTIYVGKVIDKKGTDVVHAIGTLVNGLLYIPRMFIGLPFGVYALDIADKINSPLFALPNMSLTYEKSLKLGRSDFMIFRELSIHFGVILGCSLAVVLILLGVPWRLTFFIPFFGSLMAYFMDLDKN